MTLALMFGLGLVALGMLGLVVYEAVTTVRGAPSARLNWLRPLIGPLAILILALLGLKRLNDRRLACSRGQK